ncbi:MAG: hypothetical protein J6X97_04440 [Lachnospiraceae bacterium]|nr:hypothetical protein [Lachnospiraceae bacterium]
MRFINLCKKVFGAVCIFVVMTGILGCGQPSQQKVDEYVKEKVPEPSHFVESFETTELKNPIYHYVYESDLRDLRFEVRYFNPRGDGYIMADTYVSEGVSKYYEEAVWEVLKKCPDSGLNSDSYAAHKNAITLENGIEMEEIAKIAAECNAVLADEWNYVSEDAYIGNIDMIFVYDKFDTFGKTVADIALNGKDDEATCYEKLIKSMDDYK